MLEDDYSTLIEHIVSGFKDHSLPKAEWTHEAHLITGLALVLEHGPETAEQIMPDMIRSFNVAKGGVNSDTDGYHHTITIFYLRVLDGFRRMHDDLDPVEMTKKMLNNRIAETMYPLRYYSKDLLFSVEARRAYVPPDLHPL